MRIHELAKELNTTSSDLLKQAKTLGVEARSSLSSLDEEDTETLRSGYKARISFEIADQERARSELRAAKQAAAKALLSESQEAEKAVLNASIQRAEGMAAAWSTEMSAPASKAAPAKAEPVMEAPAVEPQPEPAVETLPETASVPASEPPATEPKAPVAESSEPEAPAAEVETPVEAPAAPVEPEAKPEAEPEEPEEDEEFEDEEEEEDEPQDDSEEEPAPAPVPTSTLDRPRAPVRSFDDDDEDDDLYPMGGSRRRSEEHNLRDNRRGAQSQRPGAGGRDSQQRGAAFGGRDNQQRGGRDAGRGGRDNRRQQNAAGPAPAPITVGNNTKVISFHGGVRVKDLATTLGLRPNVVISELMKLGVFASINQAIDATSATKIAQGHGFVVDSGERTRRNSENRQVLRAANADDAIPEDRPEDLKPRPPVVTFLGHVDHGKTSLMDFIRKAHVAAGESGGITQHIGAYCLEVGGRPLTFLDTPGHAAFSAMRQRGAHLTDIAVIIIAADDGIMPQTKEAIRAAKDAGVTIMVAINKIDKPQSNIQRVMQQLQGEKLTPEEWGGDIVCCPVSAMTGEGVDNLLDMIFLQAEMLELQANPKRRANGSVIEAQMEPGRGPIATVLVTGGTLNVGDSVLCGEYYGKLKALVSTSGTRVRTAGPSQAVQIVGLSGVPEAGAEFMVMPNEKRARDVAAEVAEKKKLESLSKATKAPQNISDIFQRMQNAEKLTLRLVLRADVQGSVEAIADSIALIKSEKVAVEIIHSGTGNITETDIQNAGAGENAALVLGFHVSTESGVNASARHNGIRIKTFSIIYELLDFVKDEMLALLPAEHREVVRGHATIKQIFALNRMGNVAGCAVDDGQIVLSAQGRVLRHKKVVHTGAFASIRHYKGEVNEVSAGQECGIRFASFEEFQEGDIIECFAFEEMPKSL